MRPGESSGRRAGVRRRAGALLAAAGLAAAEGLAAAPALSLRGDVRSLLAGLQDYPNPRLGWEGEDGASSETVLRLIGEVRFGEDVELEMHGGQRVQFETLEGERAGRFGWDGSRPPAGRYRATDEDGVWAEHEDGSAEWFLDRLALKVALPRADLAVGRQAVNFNQAWFWNPLDVFAPFGALQFDRDYKTGVDAARLDVPLGRLAGASLVGALGRGAEAAHFAPEEAGGFSAIGLTEHAEVVLGAGRRFAGDWDVEAEYFYNGAGAGSAAHLNEALPRVAAGTARQMGRHFLGAALRREFHPRWKGSLVWILSGTDGSSILQPGVSYSAAAGADVLLGALVGLGAGPDGTTVQTEFGAYPDLVYLELKLYF